MSFNKWTKQIWLSEGGCLVKWLDWEQEFHGITFIYLKTICWENNISLTNKVLFIIVASSPISGVSFNKQLISCDVPQSSVLRPSLFLIYIKDLIQFDISDHFTLFVDDTTGLRRHYWQETTNHQHLLLTCEEMVCHNLIRDSFICNGII